MKYNRETTTLNEALALCGFTARDTAYTHSNYKKEIVEVATGKSHGMMTAGACWSFLAPYLADDST